MTTQKKELTPIEKATCKVVYKIDSAIENNIFRCGSLSIPIFGLICIVGSIFSILFSKPMFYGYNNIIFDITNIIIPVTFIITGILFISTKFIKVKSDDYMYSVIKYMIIINIPALIFLYTSFYLTGLLNNAEKLIHIILMTIVFIIPFCILARIRSWCPKLNKINQ